MIAGFLFSVLLHGQVLWFEIEASAVVGAERSPTAMHCPNNDCQETLAPTLTFCHNRGDRYLIVSECTWDLCLFLNFDGEGNSRSFEMEISHNMSNHFEVGSYFVVGPFRFSGTAPLQPLRTGSGTCLLRFHGSQSYRSTIPKPATFSRLSLFSSACLCIISDVSGHTSAPRRLLLTFRPGKRGFCSISRA
jgi:hypothetical protein